MGGPFLVKELWDKYGLSENVREHCKKVCEVALRIGENIKKKGKGVDLETVELGALLHDLGRARTHGMEHFIFTGQILRKEGLPEKIVLAAERHFAAGITREEGEKLGLPIERDHVPISLEEKIVCYADKVVKGDREVSFEEFLKRLDELEKKLPETAWFTRLTRERIKKIRKEIELLGGFDK